MRNARRTSIAVAGFSLIAIGLAFAPPAAHAYCYSNRLGCGTVTLSELPRDSTGGTYGSGTWSVEFDLPAGTTDAIAIYDIGGCRPTVEATDGYVIEGLPAGPVQFRARLHVDAFAFGEGPDRGGAEGDVTLLDEWGASATQHFGGGQYSGTFDLELPLTRTVGQEFTLTMRTVLFLYFNAACGASAQIQFLDLPPGATVRSCTGYQLDVPVPAVRASWGVVKSRYR